MDRNVRAASFTEENATKLFENTSDFPTVMRKHINLINLKLMLPRPRWYSCRICLVCRFKNAPMHSRRIWKLVSILVHFGTFHEVLLVQYILYIANFSLSVDASSSVSALTNHSHSHLFLYLILVWRPLLFARLTGPLARSDIPVEEWMSIS